MNVLTPEFQFELMRVVLMDHAFLPNYGSLLSEELFKDKKDKLVLRQVLKYFEEYNAVPSKEILKDVLSKRVKIDESEEYVERIYSSKIKHSDYITDNLVKFVQATKLKDLILSCQNRLVEGKFSEILHDMQEIVYSFDRTNSIGESFFGTAKNVIRNFDRKGQAITTGLIELDEKLSGGGIRGNCNVILTPPNRGKTTTLINITKGAILGGFRTVYITTELSSEVIRRRFIMSFTGMTKHEIIKKKKTAFENLMKVAAKVINDSLIVNRFPAGKHPVSDIEKYLRLYKNQYGYIPDMIAVDYATLFNSDKKYDERRHEIGRVYLQLREMATTYNSALWTAHQTNRRDDSSENELITYKDVAEDFSFVGTVDVIASLNQTMKEKRSGEARIFLAKNRDDESDVTIPVRVDWTRAQIMNSYLLDEDV